MQYAVHLHVLSGRAVSILNVKHERYTFICIEGCLGTKCRIWETYICTYRLYIWISWSTLTIETALVDNPYVKTICTKTYICTHRLLQKRSYRLYIWIVYEGCLNSECRPWEVRFYMYRVRGLSQYKVPNMRNIHLYISWNVEYEGYTFAYVVWKGCLIIECQTSKMCTCMYYRRGLGIRIIRWFKCLFCRI